MKYSLRKSFSFRRRRETLDDDQTSPKLESTTNSTSNSNLFPTKKSNKTFLSHSQSTNKNKSKLFEPRSDIQSNDDDDEPFINSHQRPFDRFTSQIRRSFRNTLHRPRPRLASTNSHKHLIFNTNEDNPTQIPPPPTLYPNISTGLSCPMTEPTENSELKPSTKRRRAPLPPTSDVNQS